MKRFASFLFLFLVTQSACKPSDPEEVTRDTSTGKPESKPQSAPPSVATQAAAVTSKPDPPAPKRPHILFPENVAWRSWDDAVRDAKASNKPILLLVYADWCPHCKELAPVFADPEVVALAGKMVLVKQDADAEAPWLQRTVGEFGSYVPRLFFLRPDGSVRADITSGNPRFPYFYTPEGIAALRASMKKAIES